MVVAVIATRTIVIGTVLAICVAMGLTEIEPELNMATISMTAPKRTRIPTKRWTRRTTREAPSMGLMMTMEI
uniref:Putative secreted protein n=1 Tax=Anopheles darlingi TaxID=43151 RepID=A0A2M4DFQ4_ANODA